MSLRYTLYIYYTFTIVHYIFHFINTLHLFRVLFFIFNFPQYCTEIAVLDIIIV